MAVRDTYVAGQLEPALLRQLAARNGDEGARCAPPSAACRSRPRAALPASTIVSDRERCLRTARSRKRNSVSSPQRALACVRRSVQPVHQRDAAPAAVAEQRAQLRRSAKTPPEMRRLAAPGALQPRIQLRRCGNAARNRDQPSFFQRASSGSELAVQPRQIVVHHANTPRSRGAATRPATIRPRCASCPSGQGLSIRAAYGVERRRQLRRAAPVQPRPQPIVFGIGASAAGSASSVASNAS